jgi:hypothetical protein
VTDVFDRLAAAGIQLLPAVEISTHYVFERGGYVALVARKPDGGFGSVGGTGILTGKGFAAAVLRGDRWFFVAKSFEQEASAEQAEQLRRFSFDLKSALES